MIKERWYYISTPYYTITICYSGLTVIRAPPIARWMIGKTVPYVLKYLGSKFGDGAIVIDLGV